MLGVDLALPRVRRNGPPRFAAALAVGLDHDAVPGSVGTLAVIGAAGPVSLVAGPQTGISGDAGGQFDLSENGGTVSVSFDRAGLGDDFTPGESRSTGISVTITDGTSSAEARIRVTLLHFDAAPVALGGLADLTLVLGEAMPTVDLSGAFSDPGDVLTFAATGLPQGLSLSAAGLLSGTPTTELTGQTITVTAADAAGQTAQSSFLLTIEQAAQAPASELIVAPQPGALEISFTGTPPAYSAVTALPGGLQLEF